MQVTGLQISWAAILNIIVDEDDRDGDKINWRYATAESGYSYRFSGSRDGNE